jgi:hypothetical protein
VNYRKFFHWLKTYYVLSTLVLGMPLLSFYK